MSLAASKPDRRVWLDRALMAALLTFVVAGLAGLAAATGWEATLDQVTMLSLGALGTLLGLSLINYGARALRWHLFARTLAVPTTAARNHLHYLAGFAMAVTPGRVGELIRLRWLARRRRAVDPWLAR